MLHFKQVLLNFPIRVDIAALATIKTGISYCFKNFPQIVNFFCTHEYRPTHSERVKYFSGYSRLDLLALTVLTPTFRFFFKNEFLFLGSSLYTQLLLPALPLYMPCLTLTFFKELYTLNKYNCALLYTHFTLVFLLYTFS